MEKNFFSIKLTDEQKRMFEGQNVNELVAVDYKKTGKTIPEIKTTSGKMEHISLTDWQKQIVEENTNMKHHEVEIQWRPAISGISKSDIKNIENITMRSCDFWSVPTSDSI